ncbi:N-acetylglucosaminyltransferase [Mycolicibacterium conceptionense]|uniref:Glycosyl transferase family protein n=1 Tax=Mycolicibacterium conceptionense TaxID=451644 RepID=A0A0U1D4J0_9MYCO|nr:MULTISPECIES: glycosyltransferase [Mycolicibacterium]MCW1819848.1 glycosyltransferase [Mycolicibacterium senegalense]OBB04663.1 N-acetylglucosaminyltransferase [Mycolicibacterium conceptionense]OBF01732.1 N-acetylglucosaminyltransferase [Mycolicibacterium conceptionense]OBF22014.1 N-acetylglucosaminyltransferase [Mycolicibacterium conceptionense]OBF34513.1 N-acetylglucosaminyltransferase [Mycolicibacterium conceptionense]
MIFRETFDPETVTEEQRAYALDRAINGLREDEPMHSASKPLMGWQQPVIVAVLVIVAALGIWKPLETVVVLIGLCTLAYLLTLGDRVLIFKRGLASRPIVIPDDVARGVPDDELPPYTILVPAYNEPEVVADLIAAMDALEYPQDRLQVLLLLEADDHVTIEAARACGESEVITIILVPPADPRTKPKACNYGLHFATGEIVTIFDAEDLPEPLQLRRVVAAFRDLPDDVACVQAKLVYHNGHQNLLTAWFTAEYALWFGYLLPGMMVSSSPIPLGGTSNHLRRDILREIGAWDPFNVTEDADLGLRIASYGYRTAVIDSYTLEEANSDAINWVRQRSRWYKGYLQTWLVHIREPVKLYRTLGLRAFIRFNLVLAGTPIIAVLNLLFWFITVLWFLGQPGVVSQVFPPLIYFPALIAMIIGNVTVMYMNMIALREDDRSDLLLAALSVPLFWLMMSIAAAKGLYQLIRQPSYWEKTFHGLAGRPDEAAADAKAAA